MRSLLFIVASLLAVIEAKKLTEANEENCEGKKDNHFKFARRYNVNYQGDHAPEKT